MNCARSWAIVLKLLITEFVSTFSVYIPMLFDFMTMKKSEKGRIHFNREVELHDKIN